MKTRLLSLILAIMVAAMPASAYDFMVNGLCYKKNSDGTSVTVTYQNLNAPTYTNISGAVNIPASVTYSGKTYSVTEVDAYAFDGCSGITSLTIPNSVTTVWNYAFRNCTNLTTVTIGKAITKLISTAFTNCSKLATVNWNAANMEDYNDYGSNVTPFYGLTSIKTFNFGNTVTRIPHALCRNLTGLTTVTISPSLKAAAAHAFADCTSLNRVNISDLVAWCDIDFEYSNSNPLYYANNLYLNGSKITNLTIPNTVSVIKQFAFVNCTALTTVTIPTTLTSCGGGAFKGCSGIVTVNWNAVNCADCVESVKPFEYLYTLQNFNFGNTVTRIPSYLCCELLGLTSVTIPSSVTSIGANAFILCRNLTKVEIGSIAAWCNIDFGDDTANPLYYARNLYLNGNKVTNLSLPNSLTKIKDYTFHKCESLTSVTMPNSVTEIGSYAFNGCSGLTSLTLSNSLKTIQPRAFYGCSGLPSLEIPNSVTSIGNYAFSGCTSMSLLTIPNSITAFEGMVYNGCTALTTIRSKLINPQSVTYSGPPIFNGVPRNTCTVYVPLNTRNSYLASSNWNTFTHIVEVDYELIERLDVNGDGWVTSGDVTALYNYLLGEAGSNFPEGDVDGDGAITSADITVIYNTLLGL